MKRVTQHFLTPKKSSTERFSHLIFVVGLEVGRATWYLVVPLTENKAFPTCSHWYQHLKSWLASEASARLFFKSIPFLPLIPTASAMARLGGTAQLTCTHTALFRGASRHAWDEWLFSSNLSAQLSDVYALSFGEGRHHVRQSLGDYTLRISNLEYSDSGVYVCLTSSRSSQATPVFKTLRVTGTYTVTLRCFPCRFALLSCFP